MIIFYSYIKNFRKNNRQYKTHLNSDINNFDMNPLYIFDYLNSKVGMEFYSKKVTFDLKFKQQVIVVDAHQAIILLFYCFNLYFQLFFFLILWSII